MHIIVLSQQHKATIVYMKLILVCFSYVNASAYYVTEHGKHAPQTETKNTQWLVLG